MPAESSYVFQVPQAVKLLALTPKKRLQNYSSIFPDQNIRKKYSGPDASNKRFDSPVYYSTHSGCKNFARVKMFKNYIKDFQVNNSMSPLLKVKIPNQQEKIPARPKTKQNLQTSYVKPKSSKKGRPARFLSQEDLENHIKTSSEKPVKNFKNEQDMKILIENNHQSVKKSLEEDKICRMYHTYFKRPGIMKKSEWNWESPQLSPRTVTFKDL
jgi:hypothetical protein